MSSSEVLSGVLVLLFILSGSYGSFIIKPTNTAAAKGSVARLTCNGEIVDVGVLWTRSRVGDAFNYQLVSEEFPRIAPSYSGLLIWASTLVINDVRLSDAGTYECTLIQTNLKAYAQLVVYEADPVCTSTPTLTTLGDGNTATTTCFMPIYSALGYYPTMTWTLVSGGTLSATTTTTNNNLTSTFAETVTCASNGRQYQVDTSFPAFSTSLLGGRSLDHSTATISYTNRFTSPAMVVYCQLTAIIITPLKNIYNPGEVITCTSNGQPPVYYGWTGAVTVSSSQVTISNQMRGQQNNVLTCSATQVYKGNTYSASKALSFSVSSLITSQAESVKRATQTSIFACLLLHLLNKIFT